VCKRIHVISVAVCTVVTSALDTQQNATECRLAIDARFVGIVVVVVVVVGASNTDVTTTTRMRSPSRAHTHLGALEPPLDVDGDGIDDRGVAYCASGARAVDAGVPRVVAIVRRASPSARIAGVVGTCCLASSASCALALVAASAATSSPVASRATLTSSSSSASPMPCAPDASAARRIAERQRHSRRCLLSAGEGAIVVAVDVLD
jgi:hypothetical protein